MEIAILINIEITTRYAKKRDHDHVRNERRDQDHVRNGRHDHDQVRDRDQVGVYHTTQFVICDQKRTWSGPRRAADFSRSGASGKHSVSSSYISKTPNRVQFACKYTCRLLLQIGLLATQTQEISHPFIK